MRNRIMKEDMAYLAFGYGQIALGCMNPNNVDDYGDNNILECNICKDMELK